MGSATLLSKKFELKTSVRKLAATCSQTRFFWTCLMSSRTSVHYNITLLHYHIKRISTIIYPNHSGILALSWQWPFGWFTASATMVRQVALVRLREKQALSRATDHVPAKGGSVGWSVSSDNRRTPRGHLRASLRKQTKPWFSSGSIHRGPYWVLYEEGICDHETASTWSGANAQVICKTVAAIWNAEPLLFMLQSSTCPFFVGFNPRCKELTPPVVALQRKLRRYRSCPQWPAQQATQWLTSEFLVSI